MIWKEWGEKRTNHRQQQSNSNRNGNIFTSTEDQKNSTDKDVNIAYDDEYWIYVYVCCCCFFCLNYSVGSWDCDLIYSLHLVPHISERESAHTHLCTLYAFNIHSVELSYVMWCVLQFIFYYFCWIFFHRRGGSILLKAKPSSNDWCLHSFDCYYYYYHYHCCCNVVRWHYRPSIEHRRVST